MIADSQFREDTSGAGSEGRAFCVTRERRGRQDVFCGSVPVGWWLGDGWLGLFIGGAIFALMYGGLIFLAWTVGTRFSKSLGAIWR